MRLSWRGEDGRRMMAIGFELVTGSLPDTRRRCPQPAAFKGVALRMSKTHDQAMIRLLRPAGTAMTLAISLVIGGWAMRGAAAVPATPSGPAGRPPSGSISVDYTGYSHGLIVLKLAGTLSLTPGAYSAHVTFHTAGMAAWMLRSTNDTSVSGVFDGGQARPELFVGTGQLRDSRRMTRIEYVDGNPVVKALAPPAERERTPVPLAQTAHTIDTLSAVALLIRTVGATGACDGSVTTFDGRRLATQSAHTAGREMLAKTSRSSFAGTALRCDFVGRQLAGFVRNEDEDGLRKPRKGAAWLAELVPGAPPVPVRVVFDNNILREVTLYLTAYSASPAGGVTAAK
jgi:hypothetical protein